MELQIEIGKRIKQLRDRHGISQRDLAERMGLTNHQAVINLEKGERELKAHELSKLASIFHISLNDFFQNETEEEPFVLWRSQPQNLAKDIESKFLRKCRDYSFFEELLEIEQANIYPLPKRFLDIEKHTWNDVYEMAESIRNQMNLSNYPAQILIKSLEDNYNIRFISATDFDVSAACTLFTNKPCVLLSASQPSKRQHFSVAHELFHLITWNEEVFQQIEANQELKKKNESLADAFAAGLLMPATAVRSEIKQTKNDNNTLNYSALIAISNKFEVSLPACIYRLANLHIITNKEAEKLINSPTLKETESKLFPDEKCRSPYEFTTKFIRLGYLCYEAGKISRARLSKALGVSLVDLPIVLNQAGFAEVESEKNIKISNS